MPSFMRDWNDDIRNLLRVEQPVLFQISPVYLGDASLTFDPNDVSDLKHKMRLITEDEELLESKVEIFRESKVFQLGRLCK
jgi:hypothetical protein